MFRKGLLLLIGLSMMSFPLFGCSGQTTQPQQAGAQDDGAISNEKINWVVYRYETSMTEEEFQRDFAEPAKKKFPNYEFKYIIRAGKGTQLEDLIVSGEVPDIILTGTRGLVGLTAVGMPLALDSLAKKYNANLNVYDARMMNVVKSYSQTNEVIGLPYEISTRALFYNKDLFDIFGVPYPKDNMTWEDVVRLSKQLTREYGGVQYYGAATNGVADMARHLSLGYVEPGSNKVIVKNDQWKRVFELTKAVIDSSNGKALGTSAFLKDQTLAMSAYWERTMTQSLTEMAKSGSLTFNWDLVSSPSFPEAPGTTIEIDGNVFVITATSKYKEQAFQLISHLTSNMDLQKEYAKRGKMSAAKIEGIDKIYGQDLPVLKGKNVAGIFKVQFWESHKVSKYDDIGRVKAIPSKFNEYVKGTLDVNTALLRAEEEIVKGINEAEGK